MRDPLEALHEYADACVRCGLCARTDCGNYAPGTPNLGAICESWLSGSERWRHFPFTCALCNRCTMRCPVGLRAADACMPLRALILPKHPELEPLYRKFRTDLRYNIFSLLAARDRGDMRDVRLVESRRELGTKADVTAFFPGCSLYAYAPELTGRVSDWLYAEGIAVHTLTFCCGAPFLDSGFYPQFDTYCERARAYLRERGIRRLIVTCPHCLVRLEQLLAGEDIEIVRLPDLLLKRGKLAPTQDSVCFHDACYDRFGGQVGTAARALLPKATLISMAHERDETYCCGGGGMVSVYAPDYCTYRRDQKLEQIDAAGADRVISTCFSCVNSMQRGQAAVPVQHYLELVFGVEVDWAEVHARVNALEADPATSELYAEHAHTFE